LPYFCGTRRDWLNQMTETPEEEVFFLTQEEKDQMLFGLYVQLTRIYDLLALIATEKNPKLTAKLIDEHSQGHVRTPAPSMSTQE
jgi:uncharacterized protein involved in exopolysaccharide biosynthesis